MAQYVVLNFWWAHLCLCHYSSSKISKAHYEPLNIVKTFPYSFRNMAIVYFINLIVAGETIKGGKLFKGGKYSRKYGI